MSLDRYLYEPQDELVAWAEAAMAESYPGFKFRADAKAICCVRGGAIVGAVVFDTFTDGDCLVHIVSNGSRRWMSKEFAIRAMAYPFLQLGNKRITAVIAEHNEDSLRFTRKFGGWVEEGRMREAGPFGQDMLLFGMLRRDCRWLPS